jgi:hypothetical protein
VSTIRVPGAIAIVSSLRISSIRPFGPVATIHAFGTTSPWTGARAVESGATIQVLPVARTTVQSASAALLNPAAQTPTKIPKKRRCT